MLELILDIFVDVFFWTIDWHRWWLWVLIAILLIAAVVAIMNCL